MLIAVGSLAALLLAGVTMGSTASGDNPYLGIVRRNAFDLRPPPPSSPPQTAVPSSIEVFLTGISTLLKKKQVLLQIVEKTPGKKPE